MGINPNTQHDSCPGRWSWPLSGNQKLWFGEGSNYQLFVLMPINPITHDSWENVLTPRLGINMIMRSLFFKYLLPTPNLEFLKPRNSLHMVVCMYLPEHINLGSVLFSLALSCFSSPHSTQRGNEDMNAWTMMYHYLHVVPCSFSHER